MYLEMVAVDCGWATQDVYRWARLHGPGKLMVVKGVASEDQTVILGTPRAVEVSFAGKKIPRGTKYWPVSSSQGKHELHGRLPLEKPTNEEDAFPPAYCHFPRLNAEFFRQLTNEQLTTKVDRKGYRKQEWTKLGRNEALDTWIYSYAAALHRGIERFSAKEWKAWEMRLLTPEDYERAVIAQAQPAPPVLPAPTPPVTPQVQYPARAMGRRTHPPRWHQS